MKCIVIDDEELARGLLGNYISRIPELEAVAFCKNPLEALEVMGKQKVDVLFLDIQMPEMTGLEFLETLTIKPMVVLTTAYPEHALDAYNLNVLDYLLKPFSFQRFVQAIQKVQERFHASVLFQQKISAGIPDYSSKEKSTYILVHADRKVHKLPHSEIMYIQSMREYVSYHLVNSKILSLNSLKKLEQELPADQFTRIHKSYLVSNRFVNTLEGNCVRMENSLTLPIGRSYKEEAIRKLFS